MVHPVIGLVEQVLELIPGLPVLRRAVGGILYRRRGVPLEADLNRVSAEPLHAFLVPAVDRIGQIAQEQAKGVLILQQQKMNMPLDTPADMDAMAHDMFEPFPANEYPT